MANEQYEIYQQGTAAALAEKQLALLNSKASPDASYPSLSAGSATGITGDVETASWMARQTNADGAALIESVKGNTLRWNQLIKPNPRSVTSKGITYTNTSDGKVTLDGTATAAETFTSSLSLGVVSGHKYVYRGADVERAVYANIAGIGPNLNSESIYTATSNVASTTLSVSVGATYAGTYECYPQLLDLTAMFGAGNEPATVTEFEALYPLPYYPYDAGSLLPVRMEGIETVGFNQFNKDDPNIVRGKVIDATGTPINASNYFYSGYIPVFPNMDYYIGNKLLSGGMHCGAFYDVNKNFISAITIANENRRVQTTPANCRYIIVCAKIADIDDICINISDPVRNGTYEPYWRSERAIAASTYFPDGMRSAGTVRDELRADAAVTRVGAVDLGTLAWSMSDVESMFEVARPSGAKVGYQGKCAKYEFIGQNTSPSDKQMSSGGSGSYLIAHDSNYTDAAAFKAAMSGIMFFYELATPTTTPIDPPIPLSYRTGAGGIERVMVASGTTSAPPIFATRYPLDPADLAASIAPVDGPTATTNHQVGDLLMLGFTLCKATQVIVTGETIAIGTNVTRTTVAAELAALSE